MSPGKSPLLILVLAAVAALVVWGVLADDSPEVGQGSGEYRRLTFTYAPPAIVEKPVLVADLKPPRSLEGWRGSASEGAVYRPLHPSRKVVEANPGVPLKQLRPHGVLLKGAGPKSLSIACDLQPHEINRAILHVSHYGPGPESIQLVFKREGKTLLATPKISVSSNPEPSHVLYEFPDLRRKPGPVDELVVKLAGSDRPNAASAVIGIELLHSPLLDFVPSAGEASAPHGRLVRIAGEERRGVGISSAHALETEFEARAEDELSFSCALDERLRVFGEEPRLKLTLEADGVPPLEEDWRLESGKGDRSRWHGARIDVSAFAGQRVRARFELEVGWEIEGFAIVAEAAVSKRGEEAHTVLLITSDTHRADHMGHAIEGEEALVSTPVLDALTERGVHFTDAYASTNVTNPSHVALMTGIPPRDTRILDNRAPLAPGVPTLAQRFAERGYRTFAAVSAHHLVSEASGLGTGFDRLSGPGGGDRDGEYTLDALDNWLTDALGQPLFVWVHVFDAHSPYGAPGRFKNRYWPAENPDPYDHGTELDLPPIQEVPPFLGELRDKDHPYAMYRGEIDYLDNQLGRLFNKARFADPQRTIVAFTSDHGESFGEHGIWWDHAGLFPESVHVPLILAWPGCTPGSRLQAPVEQMDVGRTLLNLSGFEEAEFPGRDLRWAIDDPAATQPRFAIAAHGLSASIQSGKWHLLLHLREHQEKISEHPRGLHEVELYDLEADPDSLVNLVPEGQHFERAKRLRRQLIRWLDEASTTGMGIEKHRTAEQEAALAGLGYGGATEVEGAFFTPDPENEWDRMFED